MVGDSPPCTQKIWLSTTADKLQNQQQQGGTKQQKQQVRVRPTAIHACLMSDG
jgi:hypothetical protein